MILILQIPFIANIIPYFQIFSLRKIFTRKRFVFYLFLKSLKTKLIEFLENFCFFSLQLKKILL